MRKKSVVILAPTGMLGSMVYKVLKDKYRLILVYRNQEKLEKLDQLYGGVNKHQLIHFDFDHLFTDYLKGFPAMSLSPRLKNLINKIGQGEAIINCAGITKPHSLKKPLLTLFINGFLPQILSNVYRDKLIQIATDCVYSGLTGAPYTEDAVQTPNDLYGLSKSLGEPRQSLVLRTSIIGPEIDGYQQLLEWFRRQKNKTIPGFTNHLWNGITTRQFALICNQIISNRKKFPKCGTFHIFSNSLSKYEMLKKFESKYQIGARIKPIKTEIPVDRRLGTKYNLCKMLNIPKFDDMLHDL
ncbi:MAG: sugar nucleotide-binding protein [Patescibacteria group bacterium]